MGDLFSGAAATRIIVRFLTAPPRNGFQDGPGPGPAQARTRPGPGPDRARPGPRPSRGRARPGVRRDSPANCGAFCCAYSRRTTLALCIALVSAILLRMPSGNEWDHEPRCAYKCTEPGNGCELRMSCPRFSFPCVACLRAALVRARLRLLVRILLDLSFDGGFGLTPNHHQRQKGHGGGWVRTKAIYS